MDGSVRWLWSGSLTVNTSLTDTQHWPIRAARVCIGLPLYLQLAGYPARQTDAADGGAMNIERCEELLDWTSHAHTRLSTCMTEGAEDRSDSLAKMLLVYLAQHEQELTRTIARIKEHADPRALQARLPEALEGDVLALDLDGEAYAQMSVDDISREVFAIHNRIIDLYRSLEKRPGLGKASELLGEMLQLEEHETMRLAQQVNRMHEL
jgi:hypothetical protein|tara:strand:+ start:327 stop:953 length:627 start_codon:yes stop_codon:yes gene_type:complete